MTAFTVRVPDETARRLDELAEIKAGLAEAESGQFASTEEVARVIAKYVKAAERR